MPLGQRVIQSFNVIDKLPLNMSSANANYNAICK
jgi:hypothetical protein